MKRLLFTFAVGILAMPVALPIRAQDGFGGGFGGGDSIDITGQLGRGGGGFGNNRGGIQMPDSKTMYVEVQSALKKGKTPLLKTQEAPLRNLLDTEIVALTDKIQVLRNGNNNNGDRRDFPGGFDGPPGDRGFPPGERGFPGDRGFPGNPGNPDQANSTNSQAATMAVTVETVTSLKNDDFLNNKIASFLSPEQVALVKKAKADDKTNATCLGGLLDRVSSNLQNNNQNNPGNNRGGGDRGGGDPGGGGRGGRGGGDRGGGGGNRGGGGNNDLFAAIFNSQKKVNGDPYCMEGNATASARLDPIRKVLAAGNLPLAKDKEPIAEIYMKSQIKDTEDALRSSLTSSFSGNRGGNNNNNNISQVIQTSTDDIYKKAGTLLDPSQVESLKKWHYNEILQRGGLDSLIAIENMENTPLRDDQVARVRAVWTEYRNQLQATAKAAKKTLSDKDLDSAVMAKVVEFLDPPQVASYQLARKFSTAK